MRIYTGRARLLEGAMIETLRATLSGTFENHIIVVPKQLTLETERTLLDALGLEGSFALQVVSPERLCQRIFEAAGAPEGARVDERGRVMLARTAIRDSSEQLSLYRGAERRRGFADRCARQLELLRQAGLGPEQLLACADGADGILSMKLRDLSAILDAYQKSIEGRFQDGESELRDAAARASAAEFLRTADVSFYGFDLTPPSLHRLIAAVAAVCPETRLFLPLDANPDARDQVVFTPLLKCMKRLIKACGQAGVEVAQVPVIADGDAPGALTVAAPARSRELARLADELYAYPALPDPSGKPPRHIQLAAARNPMEECLFAAALCRRLAVRNGWRWNDFLILCPDPDSYRQSLKDAFRAYGVPVFLSSSRPAARHALAECLLSALRIIESRPQAEDALSLMRTGFMPITDDEADRLANHMEKYGVRPYALLRPLRRGSEAELLALEPVRERFAAPLIALKDRLKRADGLKSQLAAVFAFLEDIDAPGRLQSRLDRLISGDLREQAGEEAQVWNRIIGALDQMAALMGDAPLPLRDLRETLSESLEAAVIKPLPQADDAVYVQPADRILTSRAKALILLGETDRAGADPDGLFNAAQLQEVARMTDAYLGSDDAEKSMLRRYYLKSALEMASDYLCVCWPLSGMDNAAQHPGPLVDQIKALFPSLTARGGVTGDQGVSWMLRAAPEAAMAHAARALSKQGEGTPLSECDAATLAGLSQLSAENPTLSRDFTRIRDALNHGAVADRLNPDTAKALYGQLRRQSITRLERFAQCPFAYFTQYGLRPERIEAYGLNPKDEGTFFHDAVHEFLLESMDDLNRIDIPEAHARMDAIADALLNQMSAQGPLGDSAVALAERRRLKATARTCAGVLTEHMRGSRFAPAALETDFGREDGRATLVVNAATGECVLEGRIDRIDEWLEGSYLRVIDYKRGGRPLNLDAVFHGLSLQLPVYLAAAMRKRREKSAGVYYFNLDEGILPLQTTDPAAVEKERRGRFKLSGLAIDDPEVLAAQSPNFPEVLGVRVTKEGSLYKGAMATDAHGFETLTHHALTKAGEHLDNIRDGEAAVAPAEFRLNTPCDWCDLRDACLFDERLDARCVRRFKNIRGDAVLELLKLSRDDIHNDQSD